MDIGRKGKIISPPTKQSYADSRKNKESEATFSLTRHNCAWCLPDKLLETGPDGTIMLLSFSVNAAFSAV
jgi:hypothetical protein